MLQCYKAGNPVYPVTTPYFGLTASGGQFLSKITEEKPIMAVWAWIDDNCEEIYKVAGLSIEAGEGQKLIDAQEKIDARSRA